MNSLLNDYLQRWQLGDPEPLAHTPTSDLYLVDQRGERRVLKLLTPAGMEDEADAVAALRYFAGHGAVQLRAFVFAYACLSASWPDKPEGGEVQAWMLTVARNAEAHVE